MNRLTVPLIDRCTNGQPTEQLTDWSDHFVREPLDYNVNLPPSPKAWLTSWPNELPMNQPTQILTEELLKGQGHLVDRLAKQPLINNNSQRELPGLHTMKNVLKRKIRYNRKVVTDPKTKTKMSTKQWKNKRILMIRLEGTRHCWCPELHKETVRFQPSVKMWFLLWWLNQINKWMNSAVASL